MAMGGGWIIDLDIQSFFDNVDWGHLRSFLDRRVRDGVIRRAIGKWLNAGFMESGEVSHPDRGTPQGGVVSPVHGELIVKLLWGDNRALENGSANGSFSMGFGTW